MVCAKNLPCDRFPVRSMGTQPPVSGLQPLHPLFIVGPSVVLPLRPVPGVRTVKGRRRRNYESACSAHRPAHD
eukprot:scaffold53858_cov28-Attheya_sp.AAC.1